MDINVKKIRIQQWLTLLEEQAKSGMNKEEWCRQNGIKRGAFFRWQRICREHVLNQKKQSLPEDKTSLPAFVEIDCSKTSPAVINDSQENPVLSGPIKRPSIRIEKSGFTIVLDGAVDEECLLSVLQALAHVE